MKNRQSPTLGIFVGEDKWMFFKDIFDDLESHYHSDVFKEMTINTPLPDAKLNQWMRRRRVQSLVRSKDVCFFEWASDLLAIASQFSKINSAIVTRLHRFEMYQWVDHINWNAVDKIILVSEAKRRDFIFKFPKQASKTIVIHPAVDIGKFHFAQKQYSGDIGLLCNLTPRKRVYDLILTFYELSKLNDNFHLHIAGGPRPAHADYFDAIDHIVRELHLEEHVTFYGNIEDAWNWYPLIDIFISNSYSEGLQVAPMEAMASGCYCLAHHWSGSRELLPEENLFYSSGELIEKIISYSKISEVDRQILRRNMRAIASEKFDVERITRQIRRVIDKVSTN